MGSPLEKWNSRLDNFFSISENDKRTKSCLSTEELIKCLFENCPLIMHKTRRVILKSISAKNSSWQPICTDFAFWNLKIIGEHPKMILVYSYIKPLYFDWKQLFEININLSNGNIYEIKKVLSGNLYV